MASMGNWSQYMGSFDGWGCGMDCADPRSQMWNMWGAPGSKCFDSWARGAEHMDAWGQTLSAMGVAGMGVGMSASSSSASGKGHLYGLPFKPKASNPPEKVFVGGLPNSTTQEGLKSYFERFGRVRTVELKYDGAGSFRGYGFVLFDDKSVAEKVFQTKGHEFNGKAIDCRRPLESGGPSDSNDNKVFVGGLPKTCTKQNVEAYFERRFGKVASLQLKYDSDDNFRGFAFVTFEDPSIADLACRTKGQTFDGKAIDCRPADSDGPGEQHDKMFVGGLPKNATAQQVEEHFSQFGKVLNVDMKYHEDGKYAGKFRGFCFVQFEDRVAADAVYANYENNRFDGKWITCRPAAKKPLIEDALDAAMKTQMNSPVPTAQLLGIDPNIAAARVAAYSAMMALNQAAASGNSNPMLGDAVNGAMREVITGAGLHNGAGSAAGPCASRALHSIAQRGTDGAMGTVNDAVGAGTCAAGCTNGPWSNTPRSSSRCGVDYSVMPLTVPQAMGGYQGMPCPGSFGGCAPTFGAMTAQGPLVRSTPY